MKTFTLYILCIFLLHSAAIAQQTIHGIILDEKTLQPVENAHITVAGNKRNTVSNKQGEFQIQIHSNTTTLKITHVSYENQIITINGNPEIKILAKQKTLTLPLFETHDRAQCIIKDNPLFVWDYTFFNNNILLLAFRNNSFYQPELVAINNNGDTLYNCKLKNKHHFYNDFKQNSYLVSNHTTWQIASSDSSFINFTNPFDTDSLLKLFTPFVAENNNTYFLKTQSFNNQILDYYSIRPGEKRATEFASIADPEMITMVRSESRRQAILKLDEFDLRFEAEFMQKPVYAPLYIINDTTYIFNFVNSTIDIYDRSQKKIKSIAISFHKKDYWKPQLIFDNQKQEIYALYQDKGISSIAKINIHNGNIDPLTDVNHYSFIENIKINDGYLYFLYKEKFNYEYKKIYKMRL